MLGNHSRRPFAFSSLLMRLHVLHSVQVPVLQPQCAMLVGSRTWRDTAGQLKSPERPRERPI